MSLGCHAPHRRRRWTVTAAILLMAPAACRNERMTEPAQGPGPRVTIRSPTSQHYDDDGDGRIDLSVDWSDSTGVDIHNVQLRLLPITDTSSNLIRSWKVVRIDSTGLRLSESIAGLISGGHARFELVVPARDGRVTRDTVGLDLSFVQLVRTLSTGMPVGFKPAEFSTICPDDSLMYITLNSSVWIVDPYALESVAVVLTPYATTAILAKPLCFAGDPYLYITEDRVRRLNRRTRTWDASLSASFESIAFEPSRKDPDLLYEGESWAGVIGLVSRSGLSRRQLLRYSSRTDIMDLAVMPADVKIYATLGEYGGILIVDPARDTILGTIDVAPRDPTWAGNVEDLVLSPDDRWLYAAATDGTPSGVAKIDTGTDAILQTVPLDGWPMQLGLSPDGRMLFVATYDAATGPSHNAVLDARSMSVLQLVPRPRPAGARRYDRGVTFRPDGRYVFVARDTDLDIYLVRPIRN